MAKKTTKTPKAVLSTQDRINFLRAYLSDMSAIRHNILQSVVLDGDGTPVAYPTKLITDVDSEIAEALRTLTSHRKELAPTPADPASYTSLPN